MNRDGCDQQAAGLLRFDVHSRLQSTCGEVSTEAENNNSVDLKQNNPADVSVLRENDNEGSIGEIRIRRITPDKINRDIITKHETLGIPKQVGGCAILPGATQQ